MPDATGRYPEFERMRNPKQRQKANPEGQTRTKEQGEVRRASAPTRRPRHLPTSMADLRPLEHRCMSRFMSRGPADTRGKSLEINVSRLQHARDMKSGFREARFPPNT